MIAVRPITHHGDLTQSGGDDLGGNASTALRSPNDRAPVVLTTTPSPPTLADHPRSPASRLLDELLGQAVENHLEVAVIRPPGRDGAGRLEADVLVAPKDRAAFEQLLVAGSLRHRPAWGRQPHRFFIAPVADRLGDGPIDWLKIDCVSDLAFGSRHELRTWTGARCLAARTGPERADASLAPADELAALLLHVVLDRGTIRDQDLSRLAELAAHADEPGPMVRPTLTTILGNSWWPEVIGAARRRDADRLLAQAGSMRQALRGGHRGAVVWRRGSSSVLRHSTKALTALYGRGPLVAFVGPDGTGKTTLTKALVDHAGMPTRCFYGGTYPSTQKRSSVPGLTTARVVGRLLGTRAQIGWHRGRGRLVILDRHPLQARPIAQDTHLAAKARLRRQMIAATLPAPDLLVTLDAPAAVLHRRRPEHSVEQLDRDRRRHGAFVGREVGSHSLQADRPADTLLDEATLLIWSQALPVASTRPLVDR